ncbi:hypothetical protein N2605_25975 [Bradyrhizobium yuanmingense]|uniref:hypothetical protein n=1 Tax=Bradyrhizobium yuanmingense TaxID=108015 RepID=UPI0021A7A6F2|nr:hypothetical protein [Bradyrhizobium sp. CB1024]UWU83005.1 hypothetical protein N2605_25975 [Bradyrhizobium sp. CB1024]
MLAKSAIKVMPVIDPRDRLLSPEHFRGLARLDTGRAPLISLYLQLPPERRVGRAWHSAFAALIHTIPQTADRALRAAAESDIQAIGRAERPIARNGAWDCILRLPRARDLASS